MVPAHGKVFRTPQRAGKNAALGNGQHPASSLRSILRSGRSSLREADLHPNNRKTPVCSDKALSETSNLAAGPAGIVELCPKSVIGTGTAKIYPAKVYEDSALVSDPQLVIFSAGVARAAWPR